MTRSTTRAAPARKDAENGNGNAASPPTLSTRDRQLYEVFQSFDADHFDWTAFEGSYRGRALIVRLMHVGSLVRLPAPPGQPLPPQPLLTLMRTALTRAIDVLKAETWDVQTYAKVGTLLQTIEQAERGTGAAAAGSMDIDGDKPQEVHRSIDVEWMESTKEEEKKEYGRLDVELRGYLSNLIKESIRLTYLAFAQLGIKTGSHASVMKNFGAVRENSSLPQHHVDLGLGIVEASLAFNMPGILPGHLSKLEVALERLYPADAKTVIGSSTTVGEVREERERAAKGVRVKLAVGVKVHVARGLIDLANGRYDSAGRHFAEVLEDGGLGAWEGQAISTSDVCLLTALCIFSTGDRDRMKRVILDRSSFKASLDDTQGWIVDLVRAFLSAKYAAVHDILSRVEAALYLNPYLSPHVRDMLATFNERSMVQYIEPFSTVRLDNMASALRLSESKLIGELEQLIVKKRIVARIDLVDKVLVKKEPNARGVMMRHAIETGKRANSATKGALVRMKLLEADIVVDPRPKGSVGDAPLNEMEMLFEMGVEGMSGPGDPPLPKSALDALLEA